MTAEGTSGFVSPTVPRAETFDDPVLADLRAGLVRERAGVAERVDVEPRRLEIDGGRVVVAQQRLDLGPQRIVIAARGAQSRVALRSAELADLGEDDLDALVAIA